MLSAGSDDEFSWLDLAIVAIATATVILFMFAYSECIP